MGIYLVEEKFVSEVVGGFRLVDVRLLPDKVQNDIADIIVASLLTVPNVLYCGGVEVEKIALRQAIERGDINPEDEDTFLDQYREQASTRMTRTEFIGSGTMQFGVFNNREVLIGVASIARVSVLARVGNEIQVRATGTLFRRNTRVFNTNLNQVTIAFIQDQASFFRGLLNTTFKAVESPITAKVTVLDPHMKNSRYASLQATINYDTSLASLMATYPEIVSSNAQEGARTYKVYSHV